ncbi:MAG TPA: PQQ-binding-like beta-propeller repeat protein [Candidatus Acidoferrales bacterium]|nr:PQQ-binding-like beta-propeller repeat protein [Candidatus Acidoferrales bacterium]
MKRKMLSPNWIRAGLPLLILFVFALWLSPLRHIARASGEEEKRENLDWRHYGKDIGNTRFQDADQINPSNVKNLEVAWVFHTGVLDPAGALPVTPIVADGRMFVTDGHDDVFALNAETGKQIWAYKPTSIAGEMPPLDQLTPCCGRNNFGVAYADETVYYGRLDDVVVALDAETGKVQWETRVADFHHNYVINMAPQLVDGKLIVSVSGGEFEVRGQVFALNAETGHIIWSFATTKPDSYGPPNNTAFLRGGATLWNTPAVDRELGLVYINTGNAAPDIQGEDRRGDNLYATSIVALDLRTGLPVWSFQEVHHDIWDYDSAQSVVLFSLNKGGEEFQAIGHCSKNGQYYILNRRNGHPIYPVTEVAAPFGMPGPPSNAEFQNAAARQPISAVEPLTPLRFDQLTAAEKPDTAVINANFSSLFAPGQTTVSLSPQYTPPDPTLRLIMPGDDGGCEWAPAAYSPRTKFVYYGTRHEPHLFQTKKGNNRILPNGLHLGSNFINRVPGSKPFGLFGATDTLTGKVVWKIRVPQPAKSGVLVAGDLVFFGEGNGKLHAANAKTGELLFTFDGPAHIKNAGGSSASPIAYVTEGREFIANAFGGNVPDRNNFTGNCSGVGRDCDNPVGDAIVAFTLPRRADDDQDKDKDKE